MTATTTAAIWALSGLGVSLTVVVGYFLILFAVLFVLCLPLLVFGRVVVRFLRPYVMERYHWRYDRR